MSKSSTAQRASPASQAKRADPVLESPYTHQELLTQICSVLEPHFGHPAFASEVVVGHVGGPEGGLNRGEGLPELYYC